MTPENTPGRRVRLEREGDLAHLLLDLPAKLNVLDRNGWIDLAAGLDALSGDPDVRCVVIRGIGGRAFSAGSDIGAFPSQRETRDDVRTYGHAIHGAIEAVRGCAHPTVAVIEGLCVGGGLEIAACCDLRVCGESSRFGAPINRLGLTMAYEELVPLVELLGPGPVLELLLTGDLIDAGRAREVGLVQRVAPDGEVLSAGLEVARRIADGAPLVNRWHKRFIRRLADPTPLTEAEREEAYEAFGTADYREGTRAFLEKRRPDFEGA